MNSEKRLKFRAENRMYDLHRPKGCTVLIINRKGWKDNEFGLWLPEAALSWNNWQGEKSLQEWKTLSDGKAQWRHRLQEAVLESTLSADQDEGYLRYSTRITNASNMTLKDVRPQICLHLVNAPEFISIHGERLWACLDGEWTTTDKVPRHKSLDPRRVKFLRVGLRKERTIVHSSGFPLSIMPEAACHPLFIAESFDGRKTVGIACKDFGFLFNNNDCILRCIHSEPLPREILPGETACFDGIILFFDGDHKGMIERYNMIVPSDWLKSML